MQERLEKIHSTGYWRINIRPTGFEGNRIESLAKCREILQESSVHLRGWDYPHIREHELTNGVDWIQSGADFRGHVEFWRFFQSGQFVHHFACEEDYELGPEDLPPGVVEPSPSGRYLSIVSSLYRITEIFEFAARLASKGVLSPKAQISVKLVGTEGRQLFFWNAERMLDRNLICRIPEMTFSHAYPEAELLARANELALGATEWIFERFNWTPVPLDMLARDQTNLLERRFV